MDAKLLSFIASYWGKANTGDTPENRGQCVGLVELWIDANKRPHIYGNAVDLLADAPTAAYTVVGNVPANYPPTGAIVCWGGTWGGGFGHTAVVVVATRDVLVVFEQNDPEGSAPVVAKHDYSGVQGWLVFK